MKLLLLLAASAAAFAEERYAVVLEEPPVAVARTGRSRVLEAQNGLRRSFSLNLRRRLRLSLVRRYSRSECCPSIV